MTWIKIKERLENGSKLNIKNGCIEWFKSKREGYGRFIIGSRSDGTRRFVSAHRMAYEISNGEIPEGKLVCHTCDNRSCINIDHLFVGSHKDNAMDMAKKKRNTMIKAIKGEGNHNAKLNWEKVKEIRSLKYSMSPSQMAKKYSVSRAAIRFVINGDTWKEGDGYNGLA